MKNTVILLFISCCLLSYSAFSQQITGVWKGKIDKKKVEIKIIQKGDSLTGTSYYYESVNNYSRYSIKGYFDQQNNSVVWWDDQLIEERNGLLGSRKSPLISVADFNCPGGGEMYLDGQTSPKENRSQIKGPVDLTKVAEPSFPDEWNYVLRNYTIGANHPDIIDSIALIAGGPPQKRKEREADPEPMAKAPKRGMVSIPPMPTPTQVAKVDPVTSKPLTIEEKFASRKKVFTQEIPLAGDSIELRFYDNAEIDGDSISLFLNNQLLFKHIRLTDKAYTIKLPVATLLQTNDLVMVAENLGSIPPNTSFMVAIVKDQRYEAMLASTENSSAVIRLYKPPSTSQ